MQNRHTQIWQVHTWRLTQPASSRARWLLVMNGACWPTARVGEPGLHTSHSALHSCRVLSGTGLLGRNATCQAPTTHLSVSLTTMRPMRSQCTSDCCMISKHSCTGKPCGVEYIGEHSGDEMAHILYKKRNGDASRCEHCKSVYKQ